MVHHRGRDEIDVLLFLVEEQARVDALSGIVVALEIGVVRGFLTDMLTATVRR
jgi:hypothetical protein